jgi:hypothetical protein
MVISARSIQMAAQAILEYVIPPLSNNWTETEEWCLLCGLYQNATSRMGGGWVGTAKGLWNWRHSKLMPQVP